MPEFARQTQSAAHKVFCSVAPGTCEPQSSSLRAEIPGCFPAKLERAPVRLMRSVRVQESVALVEMT